MIKNISKIQSLLKEHNLKLWVMINSKNKDKIFCKVISKKLITFSMCFITPKETYLIVQNLDKDNLDKEKLKKYNIHVVTYNLKKDLEEKIEDIIAELKFIDDISLSYSKIGDANIDMLGHGEFLKYKELLLKPYDKYNKKVKFSSAEDVMYDLLAIKTEAEIEKMKIVTKITNDMIKRFFKKMKVGMTEIDIALDVDKRTYSMAKKYINENVKRISLAWKDCPIVLIGENLTKGGHSLPSNKVLNYGDTIYIDFGIKVEFNTGESLYSDIQRMGYVLNKREKKVPKKVLDVFNTLKSSIEETLDYMKPGAKGYVIDEMIRNKIVKKGYPNYNHASRTSCF